MSPRLVSLITVTAVGSGLCGGVFFAFSTFVMPALARLPNGAGITAMNAINVAAVNRWFMGALFGTALTCALLAISSVVSWSEPGARLRFAASLLYIAGAIVVTIACNVPRNDALAAVTSDCADAPRLWTSYLAEWCAWNHVRAASCLAASVMLILSVVGRAR